MFIVFETTINNLEILHNTYRSNLLNRTASALVSTPINSKNDISIINRAELKVHSIIKSVNITSSMNLNHKYIHELHF